VIEDLKPYPEYKDSGLPWLGQVPMHWEIERGKSYLQAIDKRSNSGKEELLTVSSTRGVVPRRSANVTMFKANSYAGHKLCWPGDLVINSLWAWNGGLGVSRHHGIVSTAYGVYRARNETEVNPCYLHELLRSSAFQWELQVRSKGVWISRLQLTDTAFLDAPIPLPPPEEQAAIARFLAWATNRLDRAIGAKRRIIALLQEQKQAIIHRAVTRGLDPAVPLKDSGIPWLGEIPEHWEVRRAKQLCLAIIDCKNRTPELVEGGEFSVVRTTNIRNGAFNPRGSYSTDRHNFEIWSQRGAPKLGDVFFTREAPVGEACLAPDRIDLCMGQRMMYFRPDPDVLDAGFMLNSIYGPVVRMYIEIQVNGSTVGHLRLGQVSALPLLWCPVTEQKAIVAHIDKLNAPMETAISRLEREITLLREYRTRLIADVVTGKLDVREAAAGLPEEIEPSIQSDAAGYDGDEAEDDPDSDPIDTEED
jgi:type I restriction enzyme S subunit